MPRSCHRRYAARIVKSASFYFWKLCRLGEAALHDDTSLPTTNFTLPAPITADACGVVCPHPDLSDSFPTIPPRKLRFLSFFSTCTRARPHKNALLRHTSRLRNASIFHILKLALGFSSTQDFAAAARGKNP